MRRVAGIVRNPDKIRREWHKAGLVMGDDGSILARPFTGLGFPDYMKKPYKLGKDPDAAVRRNKHILDGNEGKIGEAERLLDVATRFGRVVKLAGGSPDADALDELLFMHRADLMPFFNSRVRDDARKRVNNLIEDIRVELEFGRTDGVDGAVDQIQETVEGLLEKWRTQNEYVEVQRDLLMAARAMFKRDPDAISDIGRMGTMKREAKMDFEDWARLVDMPLRSGRPEEIADTIKQFGFDWVGGEEDAEEVDLRSVAEWINDEPGVWEAAQGEVSQILLKKLKRYVKNASMDDVSGILVEAAELLAAVPERRYVDKWAKKTEADIRDENVEMMLVGVFQDVGAYYAGSDGNYWYTSGRGWSNKGPVIRNGRGVTLEGDDIGSLPRLRSSSASRTASIPNIVKYVTELVIEDWPYGRETTKAEFVVRGSKGKRWVERVTWNPKTGRPNKAKKTTQAPGAMIGIGSDGKTYPITGRPGQIGVWMSDMKRTFGSVFTGDPDYEELAKALGFNRGPARITTVETRDGVQIDGLQGEQTSPREIMNHAGFSNAEIEDVESITRRRGKSGLSDQWIMKFKDGREPFIITVMT